MGLSRQVANAVSISRVALGFAFIACFSTLPGPWLNASLAILVVAQLSDHLDGFIARRIGSASQVGWLVDSFSDRAFYIACLLTYERVYGTSVVLLWLFVIRELALYASRVAVGEFKHYRGGALIHAAFTRLAILYGCVVPYGILGVAAGRHVTQALDVLVSIATFAAYVHLTLMIKWWRETTEQTGK